MKITFEELLAEKDFLHTELLQSLPPKVVEDAVEKREYDIKLVVNGVDVDPKLLNIIFEKTEIFVNERSKEIVKNKLEESEQEAEKLLDLVREAKESIIDKYNLD
ncbi:hypothetical protein HYO65_gp069 [Tenacibaculum phage PTm1]|uniref:Uncharacterized protein n=2 Tax=Shirahamavirus PTm1 TaxID=2846435 RepID=A0A5S9HXH4_9CAUD|nr:hypothetical protein HYO65_gp069 [Tenacibaculum phage PTm1]BBI90461.1 hypothetical protein [Tenacibaculum phage PTm1]BBI90769.1 hypothetical protein [Tenacibaculum phage PTm5]